MIGGRAGYTGVTNPGSNSRYVAMFDVDGSIVTRIAKRGGQVERFTRLSRPLTFPKRRPRPERDRALRERQDTGDGAPERWYGEAQRFGVLDARNLKLRKVVKLPGQPDSRWISADGCKLYLVKYRGQGFSNQYELRSFDLEQWSPRPRPDRLPTQPRRQPYRVAADQDHELRRGLGLHPLRRPR